ncbi:S-methyl-5-thioribose kinase [Roseinatronobacter sp.]|uniref:S-methyl-5-thioribose kinase n=1 Tax=Roseinatronobacter sp. TaxID=1945755 RepID=UPI003F7250A9
MSATPYEALTPETVAARLGDIVAVSAHAGPPETWQVSEVGDGNLNLVFIVTGSAGQVIVKQALPYVRLVGESWPLPLKRAFFEYNALIRQAARAPGMVPEVYHYDDAQALVVMEFLTDHVILRQSLMQGIRHEGLGAFLGLFCARTLFHGSDLSMNTAERKRDLACFAENIELCDITENLVFSDPYFTAPMNRHTPALDPIVDILRGDRDLKVAAQHLKAAFANNAETLLHGDLHTGSVMVCGDKARVIDPEFATYGPIGFDVGMLIANFLMAACAVPGHLADAAEQASYQDWILATATEVWDSFAQEFTHLWRSERKGILYQATLFEDQNDALGAEQARLDRLAAIWRDALGFCGVEMHRRILGLAHIAEYDQIAGETLRARCEARGLMLGRALVIGRDTIRTMTDVTDLAHSILGKDYL